MTIAHTSPTTGIASLSSAGKAIAGIRNPLQRLDEKTPSIVILAAQLPASLFHADKGFVHFHDFAFAADGVSGADNW